MFEAAEAFDVRYLEYFARLGRRYVMSLKPSNAKPDPEKVELAKIKVEQAMREIVDGQTDFAETFINAAYSDEPGTVVWGLGMTVWSSSGPMMEDELRKRGKSILDAAAKKRPAHRLLVKAHAIMAKADRNYAKAHRFYDMMLRLEPADVEAVADKIDLFMTQEEFQKAAGMLAKALQRWPDSDELHSVQRSFQRDSKQCPRCGTYMRFAAPFCPKCKHSFM
ncbi:MAG: tetratricopeptide repeat protein [Planctomycetes bacterium]|nr:tetratricopeptide repeat protein [Planctomycetota bacterium]MCA8936378.1 tetratricopeptide repeat protein [Planctomycetota bacterium]